MQVCWIPKPRSFCPTLEAPQSFPAISPREAIQLGQMRAEEERGGRQGEPAWEEAAQTPLYLPATMGKEAT